MHSWYLKNARVLPWRTPPQDSDAPLPDPYRVLISEIILQQTTVAVGQTRVPQFLDRFPTCASLAQAQQEEVADAWAGLGYYARARNLHKAMQIAHARHGDVPTDEAALLELPGVGPYTAAAVAAIAGGHPAVVVDTNIERIMARVHAIATPLPKARHDIQRAAAAATPSTQAGAHAQALMDLAASVCRPKAPACPACPLQARCLAFAQGNPETYPVKAPKTAKPTRRGIAWVLVGPQGDVWIERRADSRMLGATLGFLDTSWDDKAHADNHAPPLAVPKDARVEEAGTIKHVFSHFALEMEVRVVWLSDTDLRSNAVFPADLAKMKDLPLSGLFRKVWQKAQPVVALGTQKPHIAQVP